jgi:cation diffusion facilitator family transporter
MTGADSPLPGTHPHVFLGEGHARNERRVWAVIVLCTVMMLVEIGGGLLFGSLALVADGLHMSTHASALLLAALAYGFARRHAQDPRFGFGTGKLGDLAGFTSAIVLAMIALLIGYEAVDRLFHPLPIDFAQALPIAIAGLAVNVASAWLLSGSGHSHHHHGHGAHAHAHIEEHSVTLGGGFAVLAIHENGVPPRFRLTWAGAALSGPLSVETIRPDGATHLFHMVDHGGHWESVEEIPEPHEFVASVRAGDFAEASVSFTEETHGGKAIGRDNNFRSALVHVAADAAVSVLVIIGLICARFFGLAWMDPLVGMVGGVVIAAWAFTLIRDTGAVLLDTVPDRPMADRLRRVVEEEGDQLSDLHLWRLGPGHLGAVLTVVTDKPRGAAFYRERLKRFPNLSHLTIEIWSKEN